MPTADKVKPRKWRDISVLFDNGWYSVISGRYEGKRNLGERWNGNGKSIGYPSQGGNPLWHVVPSFLRIAILHGLLDEIGLKRSYSKFAPLVTKEILMWQRRGR